MFAPWILQKRLNQEKERKSKLSRTSNILWFGAAIIVQVSSSKCRWMEASLEYQLPSSSSASGLRWCISKSVDLRSAFVIFGIRSVGRIFVAGRLVDCDCWMGGSDFFTPSEGRSWPSAKALTDGLTVGMLGLLLPGAVGLVRVLAWTEEDVFDRLDFALTPTSSWGSTPAFVRFFGALDSSLVLTPFKLNLEGPLWWFSLLSVAACTGTELSSSAFESINLWAGGQIWHISEVEQFLPWYCHQFRSGTWEADLGRTPDGLLQCRLCGGLCAKWDGARTLAWRHHNKGHPPINVRSSSLCLWMRQGTLH